MLNILADENIRREIVDFLRGLGHDVITPNRGTSDKDVIELAKKEKRILVTHDLDFSNIFIYPPNENQGIVVIRILPPAVKTIKNSLLRLTKTISSQKEFLGKLIILEAGGYRTYGEN